MKKIAFFLVFSTVMVAYAGSVVAQDIHFDSKRFYVGGGLAYNTLAGAGSGRGLQFFGGYTLPVILNDDISTALEIGYMDSGQFEQYNFSAARKSKATGLWVSTVEMVPLTNKTYMQARLGYDFGDDNGFLVGAGLAYKFDTRVTLKTEYVARNHIDGLQFNLQVGF